MADTSYHDIIDDVKPQDDGLYVQTPTAETGGNHQDSAAASVQAVVDSLSDEEIQARVAVERDERYQRTIQLCRAVFPPQTLDRDLFEEDLTAVKDEAGKSSLIRKWLRKANTIAAKAQQDGNDDAAAVDESPSRKANYYSGVIESELANARVVGWYALKLIQGSVLFATHDDETADVYISDDVGHWGVQSDFFGLTVARASDNYLLDVAIRAEASNEGGAAVGLLHKVAKSLATFYTPSGVKNVRARLYQTFLHFEDNDDNDIFRRGTPGAAIVCEAKDVNGNQRYLGVKNGNADLHTSELIDDPAEVRTAFITADAVAPYRFRPELGTTEPFHEDVVKGDCPSHRARGCVAQSK